MIFLQHQLVLEKVILEPILEEVMEFILEKLEQFLILRVFQRELTLK